MGGGRRPVAAKSGPAARWRSIVVRPLLAEHFSAAHQANVIGGVRSLATSLFRRSGQLLDRPRRGARSRGSSSLYLAALALSVRLLFLVCVEPWLPDAQSGLLRDDAFEYHQLALTLTNTHEFSLTPGGQPEALRTPVYPLFVALWYALAGAKPWLVLAVQCVIDSFTCYLLYRAAIHFVSRRAALFTAALYALDPYVIFYTARLLSEIVFNFVVVILLMFVARAVSARSPGVSISALIGAGISAGVAALVRPAAQALPLLIAGGIAVSSWRVPRHVLVACGVFGLSFVLTIVPWLLRNDAVFEAIALSYSDSYNLLALNVAPFEAQRTGTSGNSARQMLLDEADQRLSEAGRSPEGVSPFEKASYWRGVAIEHIAREPLQFARAVLGGLRGFFLSVQASSYVEPVRLVPIDVRVATVALVVDLIASYLLASIGLLAAARDRRWLLLLVAIGGTAYFAVIAGAAGYARFRIPALPFYLLLSGLGAEHLLRRIVSCTRVWSKTKLKVATPT